MKLPPIDFRHGDCREVESFLADRLYEFNSTKTGYFDGEAFSATQRDESGAIVAGISGYTWGGCCFVAYLWVAEEQRGRGLGAALLRVAEQNAVARGCSVVLLSSHSFQAPGFYLRQGYEEKASVKDHPVGHTNVFYAKRLDQNAA